MDKQTAEILKRIADLMEDTYHRAQIGMMGWVAVHGPTVGERIKQLQKDIAELAGGDDGNLQQGKD